MKNKFTVLFGEMRNGHLMRLPYLGYFLLLALLVLSLGLIITLAISAGEYFIGGDLLQAQDKLREWFTLPFIIIFGLLMVVLIYAGANITAKRIRDIGLPGWWVVLAIIALEGIVFFTISSQASNGLHHLIWILLLLIPSKALTRKSAPNQPK